MKRDSSAMENGRLRLGLLNCVAFAMVVTPTQTWAQSVNPNISDSADSQWEFQLTPYIWASGLSGSIGLFNGPPQAVDLSFGEVVEDLDFAFMAAAEARRDRLMFGVDLTYARVSDTVQTPVGIAAGSIDATIETIMATAVAGYDLSWDPSVHLDLVGGARLWSVDNDFRFIGGILDGRRAADGDSWIDPLIGFNVRVQLSSRFYFAGWALVGGFGAGSDHSWDVMGGIGYRAFEDLSLFAGYRAVDVDYAEGGFVYDVVQQGPVIGGVIHF